MTNVVGRPTVQVVCLVQTVSGKQGILCLLLLCVTAHIVKSCAQPCLYRKYTAQSCWANLFCVAGLSDAAQLDMAVLAVLNSKLGAQHTCCNIAATVADQN